MAGIVDIPSRQAGQAASLHSGASKHSSTIAFLHSQRGHIGRDASQLLRQTYHQRHRTLRRWQTHATRPSGPPPRQSAAPYSRDSREHPASTSPGGKPRRSQLILQYTGQTLLARLLPPDPSLAIRASLMILDLGPELGTKLIDESALLPDLRARARRLAEAGASREQGAPTARVAPAQVVAAVRLLLADTLLLVRCTGKMVRGNVVLEHVGYVRSQEAGTGSSDGSTGGTDSSSRDEHSSSTSSTSTTTSSSSTKVQFTVPPGMELPEGATASSALYPVPDIPPAATIQPGPQELAAAHAALADGTVLEGRLVDLRQGLQAWFHIPGIGYACCRANWLLARDRAGRVAVLQRKAQLKAGLDGEASQVEDAMLEAAALMDVMLGAQVMVGGWQGGGLVGVELALALWLAAWVDG